MGFSPKVPSRVEGFSTEVEKIRLVAQALQDLQGLKDRIEKLPDCRLRKALLDRVEMLLDSTTLHIPT